MKLKTCKICKTKFTPIRTLQPVCGKYECNLSYALQITEKAEKKKQQQEKKVLREKLKTTSDYMKEAQEVFNKYIRLRDEGLPCISCQRHHQGQYHAGHYRSVGAAPQLRFNELNVHKQCSACNNHKSGNVVEYRINLIKKIGLENVEMLETSNNPVKYSVDEIIELKKNYLKKIAEIK